MVDAVLPGPNRRVDKPLRFVGMLGGESVTGDERISIDLDAEIRKINDVELSTLSQQSLNFVDDQRPSDIDLTGDHQWQLGGRDIDLFDLATVEPGGLGVRHPERVPRALRVEGDLLAIDILGPDDAFLLEGHEDDRVLLEQHGDGDWRHTLRSPQHQRVSE